MATIKRIGFFGLGRIGFPVAANLARAGFELRAFDPRPRSGYVTELQALGVQVTGGVGEAISGADVVVTLLPDSTAVESVLCGPEAAKALSEEMVCVDMSTGYPEDTRRIARHLDERHGIRLVDAPICNGGVSGAYESRLTLMVGGDQDLVARLSPLFDAVAGQVRHVGPVGVGQVMKLVSNYLTFGACALVAEGLAVAEANGLDAREAALLLGDCAGSNWVALDHSAEKILADTNDQDPQFRLSLARKDLRYMAAEGARAGVPQPVADAVHQLLLMAERAGYGGVEATTGPWQVLSSRGHRSEPGTVDHR